MLKSVAKIKKKKTQIRKTKNKRKILENLTHYWDAIFEKVTEVKEEVSEKNLVAKCEGGNMTSEWSEVLGNVGDIEKKLFKKSEEGANSEHSEEDQTSDSDSYSDSDSDSDSDTDSDTDSDSDSDSGSDSDSDSGSDSDSDGDWDEIFEKGGDILYLLHCKKCRRTFFRIPS
jgi:hypothetical protein